VRVRESSKKTRFLELIIWRRENEKVSDCGL
jgi:hypothetical protein